MLSVSHTSPPRAFPVVLAGFTAFLGLYATQPLLPALMRVFDATHFAVSLSVTAPTMAVALAAPVVGRLADLVGRKRVIVGSAIGLTAATALSATASTLTQFILWRFVQGLMTPGVFAITIAYIHDEWPVTHAGRASGAYVAGTVTGGFTGRLLVGLVASAFGWQAGFLSLACVNLVAATALALWLPRESLRPRRRQAGLDPAVEQSAVSPAVSPACSTALPPAIGPTEHPLRRLLTNRQLMATNAVGFCVLFSQVAIFTYVTFYLSDAPFGLSTAALGWLFIVYLVGAAVVPVAGRWIDLRGYRATLAIGMACGLGGALLTLTPWLAVIVTGLALVGTGAFIGQATASSYIGAVTMRDRGLAVGLYSTAYYLGGSLGGTLPALFWTSGGWFACVSLVVAVQIATAVIALGGWRK